MAERFGVSTLFIGLVLVGFGTSVPELATSVNASVSGSPAIALGNVIGSNIANIWLILGVTASIAVVRCDRAAFKRDIPILSIATLTFVILALTGAISRYWGLGFLAILAVYIAWSYRTEKQRKDAAAQLHEREAELITAPSNSLVIAVILFLGGVFAVLFGASLIVSGSITAARLFHVPETVIGLTIVAIGTSLPELAASITAARKKQTDLAYGNIIGSNIFNTLGISGAAAVAAPVAVPENVITFDLWVLIAATGLLIWFAYTGARISRWEGVVFLGLYLSYIALLFYRAVGYVG